MVRICERNRENERSHIAQASEMSFSQPESLPVNADSSTVIPPGVRMDRFLDFSTHPDIMRKANCSLSLKEPCRIWMDIVGNFTVRSLTYPSDKLPAVSALAQCYSALRTDRYLAGLWGLDILSQLTWRITNDGTDICDTSDAAVDHARQHDAPPWSWASASPPSIHNSSRIVIPDASWTGYSAKLLEAECTPLNAINPFGQVREGHLMLHGYYASCARLLSSDLPYSSIIRTTPAPMCRSTQRRNLFVRSLNCIISGSKDVMPKG